MRILQLIDSLQIGGAEKMAVNFANALETTIDFSGIVVTRKEGKLVESIEKKANYLFLNRKKTIDYNAILTLKKYCKKNQVDYIQAHGTSFFFVFLLKVIHPRISIIFHDHNGARSFQRISNNRFLWLASFFFKGIIVVNHSLEQWAIQKLNCKKVLYLPNFTMLKESTPITKLEGFDDKRILILANLRHPKNHLMLVEVAIKLKETHPDWTFHLVGKDENDSYSLQLKKIIKENNLEKNIFIYGQKDDIKNIISQVSVCVLSSSSEGLPVAILEYGLMRKPVLSTNVGEIPLLIENDKNGYIVPINHSEEFYKSLQHLIDNSALRTKFGDALFETISETYSEKAVITTYLNWMKTLK
jgi:glycosyltransferase involved in cell wall biosynthesis